MRKDGSPLVDIGVASRAREGQIESGDLHLVQRTNSGTLFVVVDGLGHGGEAATAARLAIDTVSARREESAIGLLKHTHDVLRQTRGVVMSVATLNARDETITWLSVGNVEGILVRHDSQTSPSYETIIQRGGVVGYRLPPLFASVLSLFPGDILIMATDGISNGFEFEREARAIDDPQLLADSICNRHSKPNDDALVLVAKYRGRKT
jgi:phosphoserine phosphatase RsbX